MPLLPSHKVLPPFSWYSLHLPTKGWPGWVGLGGWLHRHTKTTPDTVTYRSTTTLINLVDRDQRVAVLGIDCTHFSYLFALHTFLTVILLPVCYTRTVISLSLNFHVLVCVLTCLVYNKMMMMIMMMIAISLLPLSRSHCQAARLRSRPRTSVVTKARWDRLDQKQCEYFYTPRYTMPLNSRTKRNTQCESKK